MKFIAIIIALVITEACILGYLLGEENEKLKKENAVLKQQLAYQKDKNAELQWYSAKMELLLAGKTAEEIFQSERADNAQTTEIKKDDDEENVIYLD